VLTEIGAVDLEIPRDRAGSFTPAIVPKGTTRLAKFNENIVAFYRFVRAWSNSGVIPGEAKRTEYVSQALAEALTAEAGDEAPPMGRQARHNRRRRGPPAHRTRRHMTHGGALVGCIPGSVEDTRPRDGGTGCRFRPGIRRRGRI
jgi:hypothetical protein